MNYEAIIGLEIHVQLKTKSKMFCSCDNTGEDQAPNTTVCPICLGQPGVLPVLNGKAVEWGVLACLAVGCKILPEGRFARKNYFYPDLPKGYQISMYDKPVGVNGKIILENIPAKGKERKQAQIGITRIHLEEDAAKLMHEDDNVKNGVSELGSKKRATLVDFNRSGTPLIEIVTEPDLRSPAEAKAFLQELRRLVRYLGISEADMEKGHLRCDANISLRPQNESRGKDSIFYPKTEIKNLNSFKAVERALEYEIRRQTALWEKGEPPARLTTRGFNDATGETFEQRVKEESEDYRYFPEPDLPPLELSKLSKQVVLTLPELPAAKRQRFVEEYGFAKSDVFILTEEKELADFVEHSMDELKVWLKTLEGEVGDEEEIWDKNRAKLAKLFSGWLISKLFGLMEKHSVDIRRLKITPENFAEFITLIYESKISGPAGLQVLEDMLLNGSDPSQIIREKHLEQISDEEEILQAGREVIENNEKAAQEYKRGKENVLMFLVGQVMRSTGGKANPEVVKKMLKKLLR